GDEYAEDNRQIAEVVAHIRHGEGEEGGHEQPDADGQENDHVDVADGRGVEGAEFALQNDSDAAHAASPSARAGLSVSPLVKDRNVSSNVKGFGVRAVRIHPRARTSSEISLPR